eukprot:TRINITY_DN9563_c0_g1_i1.p2 TRINITY_DN9563_c0_g1~~TRINITY_DN9563_c0_g1_i1.p2  ORF type:complete len:201 (+),score=55.05 TRINITY_DN9563_c0_g1_i1:1667-2269(+)
MELLYNQPQPAAAAGGTHKRQAVLARSEEDEEAPQDALLKDLERRMRVLEGCLEDVWFLAAESGVGKAILAAADEWKKKRPTKGQKHPEGALPNKIVVTLLQHVVGAELPDLADKQKALKELCDHIAQQHGAKGFGQHVASATAKPTKANKDRMLLKFMWHSKSPFRNPEHSLVIDTFLTKEGGECSREVAPAGPLARRF